jgi:transcriptional regulator with GAF, ATPase, and Fis domain
VAGERARAREYGGARRRAVAVDVVRILGVGSAPSAGLPSLTLRRNLEWAEKETVRRALESAGGVKKDAAQAMGISQRALSYYLAKYRVE